MHDDAIADLARAAGLSIDWRDGLGRQQRVTPDALRRILDTMGLPCSSTADMTASTARLAEQPPRDFITADTGHAIALDGASGRYRLTLEHGVTCEGMLDGTLPPIDGPGYHRLEYGDRIVTIAVAPPRCFAIGDAAPGRRAWGTAVQLYGLNERRGSSHGDFGALADFARAAGRAGADALAISPVHELFAADATRFSPYAPSTRLFLNPMFADPGLLGGEAEAGDAGELIDWSSAIPRRMALLRAQFDAHGDTPEIAAAIDAFARTGGADLHRNALFDALHAHFFAAGTPGGWQQWPAAFHDPGGAAVAGFARDHARAVRFQLFVQWLADRSLANAQATAKQAGMAVGLIADLAVGMDGGGSHAWSRRDDLLDGFSVGAPPDLIQPAGQDWGLATFSPQALRATGFAAFIATLRTAMRHAGGVRIDHAMGLRRLWIVPHGSPSSAGAYLTYPMDDMLRLVALESQRHRAIVIAEDLGTVPDGFRESLAERAILGMRVLWFERATDGGFVAPWHWDRAATALTATHDLPTAAGWWRGGDIDWAERIGHIDAAAAAEARSVRAQDRERLWGSLRYAGAAQDGAPPADAPARAVDATVEFVARSNCELAIVPVEDLLGLDEQPNIPGTIDEHPNWRRRLPGPAEALFAEPAVAARIATLNRERPR